MNPINGWNELQESGTFEQLKLGGHICVIDRKSTRLNSSH